MRFGYSADNDKSWYRLFHIVEMHDKIPIIYAGSSEAINASSLPQNLWFYVSVKRNTFTFKAHMNHEWVGFLDILRDGKTIQSSVKSLYLGLHAFHGISSNNGDGLLKNAPTIPANFDYVKINPLPCDE